MCHQLCGMVALAWERELLGLCTTRRIEHQQCSVTVAMLKVAMRPPPLGVGGASAIVVVALAFVHEQVRPIVQQHDDESLPPTT